MQNSINVTLFHVEKYHHIRDANSFMVDFSEHNKMPNTQQKVSRYGCLTNKQSTINR
jgi:hypothetical protein